MKKKRSDTADGSDMLREREKMEMRAWKMEVSGSDVIQKGMKETGNENLMCLPQIGKTPNKNLNICGHVTYNKFTHVPFGFLPISIYGAIQVLRNADGGEGCQIFRKKALRRCKVHRY